MRAEDRGVVLRLEESFDVSHLVSALKDKGWTVRRRATSVVSGALVDTAREELRQAGLVAIEEGSGRSRRVEVWFFPQKDAGGPRLVLSASGSPANAAALLEGKFPVKFEAKQGVPTRFRREALRLNAAFGRAKAVLRVETVVVARQGARKLSLLGVEALSGGPLVVASIVDLAGRQGGVGEGVPPGPGAILEAAGIEVGPRAAAAPLCGRGQSAGEAAVAILGAGYAGMLSQENGARMGLDPEYVHNMRVALRRMRGTLRMYSKAFIKEGRARLNAQLRWLANLLGNVRDLDVYADSLPRYLAYVEGDMDDYAFYVREFGGRRRAARKELVAALDSARYSAFKDDVERFLSAPPLSGVEIKLEDVAYRGLRQFKTEVFRKTSAIRSEKDLHSLRISFKRLRYATEFLSGIAPKRMGEVAGTAAKYQDILGRFNDAVVACGRAREAVRDDSRDRTQVFLLGYLLACERLAAIEARNEFIEKWRGKGSRRLAEAIDAALKKLARES